jgi:hypothetical protein
MSADVGTVGGEASRDLGTLGNSTVAGDQDVDVPDGLTQPLECPLVGAHLIRRRGSSSGIKTSESMSPASRTVA